MCTDIEVIRNEILILSHFASISGQLSDFLGHFRISVSVNRVSDWVGSGSSFGSCEIATSVLLNVIGRIFEDIFVFIYVRK